MVDKFVMRIGIQQQGKSKRSKIMLSTHTLCLGLNLRICLVSTLFCFLKPCVDTVASKEHISINDATDATTNDDDVTTVSQNNLTERLDVTKGSKRLPTSTVVSSSTAAAATTTTTKLKKNPNAPKRFKR